jgi:hypothetical protein
VELAGAISTKYPHKNITLVHSHRHLLHEFPEKASEYAEKFLQKHNVNLLLKNKAIDYDYVLEGEDILLNQVTLKDQTTGQERKLLASNFYQFFLLCCISDRIF